MSRISAWTLTGELQAQTHFSKTETTRNYSHENLLVTWLQVKILHKQQTSHIQNNTQTNLDLWNTTLGYCFHFQNKNPRTFPIERFAHDSGRTLVRVEYNRRDLHTPTIKEEIRRYSSQYSARLSTHPNDLVVNLMAQPDNRQLLRHVPNNLPTRFLV
jgi:hypothetical protein